MECLHSGAFNENFDGLRRVDVLSPKEPHPRDCFISIDLMRVKC